MVVKRVFSVGVFLLGTALGGAALAQMGGSQGGSHEGHGAMSHGQPAAPMPQGVVIRESSVQGHAFTYRLYSWDERNVMMKGMEGDEMAGMDASGTSSHHLMVFVKDAAGKELSGGKVGFILTGPDKTEQKTLTMAMSGGYGADVALRAKGAYAIRAKAVFGDRTLNDDFTYVAK
jgi:hypothetical protein